MKNDNVIKMARLMVGGSILTTCEDCLSQRKKLFSDNKCALIEYAELLDKAGYRQQSKTVTEFAEKAINSLNKYCYIPRQVSFDAGFIEGIKQAQATLMELAEQYGKEEKE